MAAKRKRMDVIKEILRMKWVLRRSNRDIALSVGAGRSTVSRVLSRATVAGLSWADVEHSFEDELENRLYGPPRDTVRSGRPEPDMEHIRGELERTGVTLELLHLEYLERHPDGYRYSQFCARYRRWAKSRKVSMHQRHVPGEKMYVDYSGKGAQIIDRHTGESTGVELFVAVLGASNYTYVEATRTQQVRDWIGSHERCMAFFGGVARDLVPDQLKSGVTGSCRYDPVIQKTYREFAQHYGATVIPARPRHPKDKAKVECAVRFAQRWVLARLRNQTFFSLEELNMAIRELLAELNNRPMAERGESRREMFERLERPALRTLPTEPFVYGEWEMARVSESYHVKVDAHYYSVPHACSHDPRTGARALVDVHKSSDTVEIFLGDRRIACHVRGLERGGYTTDAAHMPERHRAIHDCTPESVQSMAAAVGENAVVYIRAMLASGAHPDQKVRPCLGVLRLGKRHGNDRLDAVCGLAMRARAFSLRHVERMLRNGMDRLPVVEKAVVEPLTVQTHDNVRGAVYYR